MARSGGMSDVVYYGAVIGGGWIGLNMAKNGAFGAGARQFATQILAAVKGSVPTVSVGPGAIGITAPTGGTTTTSPAGCGNTDFIPGTRYVADVGGGQYETVIGGRRVFGPGDKASAEAYYRAHVCGG
jgi:hypothetical protein